MAEIIIIGEQTSSWTTGTGKALNLNWSLGDESHASDTPGKWFSGQYYHGSTRQLNFMTSTSNYFRMTGVQLEVGKGKTPFDNIGYEEMLAWCKRYYQQVGPASSSAMVMTGAGNGSQRIRGMHMLIPEMRAAPTVTHDTSSENPSFYSYSGSPPGYSSVNGFSSTTKNFHWDFNTGNHNQAGAAFDVKGSGAMVKATAEL